MIKKWLQKIKICNYVGCWEKTIGVRHTRFTTYEFKKCIFCGVERCG